MAFRRSAVRSRLAPPPHQVAWSDRGRTGDTVTAPSFWPEMLASATILRLVLLLAMVLGPMATPRAALDPGLALAMAAGSLCMGDEPADRSAEPHDHCVACQALTGWAGLPPAVLALAGPDAARQGRKPVGRADLAFRWHTYASRAPPGRPA